MYYSNSNPKRITKKRFFKVGNIHHILQNQHYPMTRVFLLRWKSHIFATFKITGGQSLVLLENAAKLQHSFRMPPPPPRPPPAVPGPAYCLGPESQCPAYCLGPESQWQRWSGRHATALRPCSKVKAAVSSILPLLGTIEKFGIFS